MPIYRITTLLCSALFSTALAASPALTKAQSEKESSALWAAYKETHSSSEDAKQIGLLPPPQSDDPKSKIMITKKHLAIGEHQMPFTIIHRKPKDGAKPPLYICLHGGGQNNRAEGPHSWDINTDEWKTQISFAALQYPIEGLFIVPRMADDRLGRWYHDLNIDAFDRFIRHAIAAWDIDPNKVYLLGISEGGYGTDKVLPYMADRFAAGNSMAAGSLVKIGSQTTCENLRDTPMRTDIGGNDTMFNRIGLAKELHQRLDSLQKANPGHYKHHLEIRPGKGHGGWDYNLGPAWLPQFSREALPHSLVWVTTPTHKIQRSQFYWLGLNGEELPKNCRISATLDKPNQSIAITAQSFDKEGSLSPLNSGEIKLYLNDKMLDLDQPISVTINDKKAYSGKAQRTKENLQLSIQSKGDPEYIFPTILSLPLE